MPNQWTGIAAILAVQAFLIYHYGLAPTQLVNSKSSTIFFSDCSWDKDFLYSTQPQNTTLATEAHHEDVQSDTSIQQRTKHRDSPTFGVYVLSLDEMYLDKEERDIILERRTKWIQAWTKVWPEIPYKWIKAEKLRLGFGNFKGHRAALKLAEADSVDIAIMMEDDAAPFNGTVWPSDLLRLARNWPDESSCLMLGGWWIKPTNEWMADVPGNLEKSMASGLTPIERQWGTYGWAIRRSHIAKLDHWMDMYVSLPRKTPPGTEEALWMFWKVHPGYLATPLLIDHSPGKSFTHNQSSPMRSRWQGKSEWWKVWLRLVTRKKSQYWVLENMKSNEV